MQIYLTIENARLVVRVADFDSGLDDQSYVTAEASILCADIVQAAESESLPS